MTHYFRIKDDVQAPNHNDVNIIITVTLESIVDMWVAQNHVGTYIKHPLVKHMNAKGALIGFNAPEWAFYDELDAVQFRLQFGDQFDYYVLGAE